MINKVILLNKPIGMTSFDAVSHCRKILKEKKIGHSGTLDPQASGLLLILTGKYTKFLPYCICDQKHYIATFSLGKSYDTQDVWGNLIETKEFAFYNDKRLEEISRSMIGKQKQIPPMYSAIKVNGKKLYELARKNVEIERQPRDIFVNQLVVKNIGENLYQMDAVVSKGTYIRTLIVDFAKKLNELGAMNSLVRLGIEHVSLDQSLTLEDDLLNSSIDIKDVIRKEIPQIVIYDKKAVMDGKPVQLECDAPLVMLVYEDEILAAYRNMGNGVYRCERGLW